MELEELRKEIDIIDKEILSLLNRRTEIAIKIGKLKRERGICVYQPDREKEIQERLLSINRGPISNKALLAIYREILSASLTSEGPMKIAYLGPEATFTHMAARQHFGSSVEYISQQSIKDVFFEVEKDRASYGVVPIESSNEGMVTHTLDMFLECELKICAEIVLEVIHNLLSRYPMKDIKKLYSHPQAFAQTRDWIERYLPNVKCIEVSSTAEAARRAAVEPNSGAIASAVAADLYNLEILHRGIEYGRNNYTRFLVIGKNISSPTGNDKTSVLFSVEDKVGALYGMLAPFAKWGINLTKIESRPSKRQAWEYVFFVDFIGHIEDEQVKKALEEVKGLSSYLKILGSYPRSTVVAD